MKKRHWICDCPEGWIYPMEIPVCQHCFLMSPREIMSVSCGLRSRKYWSKISRKKRQEMLKKIKSFGTKRKVSLDNKI